MEMAQEQETQYALLIPWGYFAREIGLIAGIETIELSQKVYEHAPQAMKAQQPPPLICGENVSRALRSTSVWLASIPGCLPARKPVSAKAWLASKPGFWSADQPERQNTGQPVDGLPAACCFPVGWKARLRWLESGNNRAARKLGTLFSR
jgi:hypothetical protein